MVLEKYWWKSFLEINFSFFFFSNGVSISLRPEISSIPFLGGCMVVQSLTLRGHEDQWHGLRAQQSAAATASLCAAASAAKCSARWEGATLWGSRVPGKGLLRDEATENDDITSTGFDPRKKSAGLDEQKKRVPTFELFKANRKCFPRLQALDFCMCNCIHDSRL